MSQKPHMGFWQIWNMCFGFMGIQFGFALQNANVSRIFQTLGASIDDIPILWVAAPVTGLIVQPIIGYMSDRTWNGLGRRRPYFLIGAVLSSASLFYFPHVPALWIAAGMLWVLDASINISMEPFRAFVGDMLNEKQRTLGYAMQSFFIGVGSVVANALPWMMTNWWDIANTAPEGIVPDSVKYSFYIGGAVLFVAVMWTIIRTKEYSPEELAAFEALAENEGAHEEKSVRFNLQHGMGLLAIGLGFSYFIHTLGWDKELFIISFGVAAFGLLLIIANRLQKSERTDNGFSHIMTDLLTMPKVMRQLAIVQFFSWFAFFSVWIYTTPAVTAFHFASSDPTSAAYNEGANWVGILMAAYNLFAVVAAIIISRVADHMGRRKLHSINLALGGLGLISFYVISDANWLLLSMLGLGFAWASTLSVPYSLLSSALPANKMGTYMGIFNFFIVIPQILAASILGLMVRDLFAGNAVFALVTGGIAMILGAVAVLRVDKPGKAA